jgi:hypothetical protein
MKSTIMLLTIVSAVVFAGCSTTSSRREVSGMAKTEIEVKITCTNPETKFTGTIDTDGDSVQLSGEGHGTFHATGREFVCVFKKDGTDGGMSISVSEGGNNLGYSSTATKFGGVRADIVRKGTDQRTTFAAVPETR